MQRISVLCQAQVPVTFGVRVMPWTLLVQTMLSSKTQFEA